MLFILLLLIKKKKREMEGGDAFLVKYMRVTQGIVDTRVMDPVSE